MGTSAAILAYHYKLSSDRDKASRFEQIRIDFDKQTFSRQEAENYFGDPLGEKGDEGSRDEKLKPEAIARLPNLFRTILTTIRSIQLYPPDSKPSYTSHESPARSILVRSCRELLDTLIHALQHQFAVLSIDYLTLIANKRHRV